MRSSKAKRKRYFDHRAASESYAKNHKDQQDEDMIYLYPEGTYLWIPRPVPYEEFWGIKAGVWELVKVQPISKSLFMAVREFLRPKWEIREEDIFQQVLRNILPKRNGAILVRQVDGTIETYTGGITEIYTHQLLSRYR